MNPKLILSDIEGTTTPISFVKDVLFPFSAKYLSDYVKTRIEKPDIKAILTETSDTAKQELGMSLDTKAAIALLLQWIEDDRKHPALKRLQGMIWEEGYKAAAFKSEVYPDVAPSLESWSKAGITLAVYSSGSVAAQKLLFTYTTAGNLLPYFRYFFDTNVGGKREVDSYKAIAQQLKIPASDILFLSDIIEELDAAKSAGMATIQLVRPGTVAGDRHPWVSDFSAIEINGSEGSAG